MRRRKSSRFVRAQSLRKGANINAADSSYGVAKYISQVNGIGNLVNIIRLRHGNKVCSSEAQKTSGAPQIYGKQYYLIEESGWKEYRKKEKVSCKYQTSIYESAFRADELAEIEKVTKKGKRLKIELRRWLGMKMGSKAGNSMKEVEFEIVGIRVLNKETGERVFNQDVFAVVVGAKREELKIEEIAEVFYRRFDLEVTNRFLKQNLFLESYQTPDLQHLDNWTLVAQEAAKRLVIMEGVGRSRKCVREMAKIQSTESRKRRQKNALANEKRTGKTYFNF